MNRTLWYAARLDPDAKAAAPAPTKRGYYTTLPGPQHVADVPGVTPNLIGSAVDDGSGMHMPVLDIDRIPLRLVPSSTEGNFHLYIDKAVKWSDYTQLLRLLAKMGILEQGWVDASLAHGQTFVRRPETPKPKVQAARRGYSVSDVSGPYSAYA